MGDNSTIVFSFFFFFGVCGVLPHLQVDVMARKASRKSCLDHFYINAEMEPNSEGWSKASSVSSALYIWPCRHNPMNAESLGTLILILILSHAQ